MRILFLQVLFCAAVSPTWTQTDTDVTSATAITSTTRRLASEDLPEDYHYHAATVPTESERNSSSTVTGKSLSDTELLLPAPRSQESVDDLIPKPFKSKKKHVLISNFKNISDKIILSNDKNDKQSFGKSNVSESVELTDDVDVPKNSSDENTPVKEWGNETLAKPAQADEERNETVITKKEIENVESRSFQESDGSVNANPRAFVKVTSSTTESYDNKVTTNSYTYQTFSDIQKVLNNNFLNINEGYETSSKPRVESIHTSQETILISPEEKPKESNAKTPVKFENAVFGPTGQTDWVPIMPDNLGSSFSTDFASSGSTERVRVSPSEPSILTSRQTTTPFVFVTTESNKILIPSTASVSTKNINPVATQESNFIPIQGLESERPTPVFQRVNPERPTRITTPTPESNNIDDKSSQPGKLYTKYRGSVKYRPTQTTESSSSLVSKVGNDKPQKDEASGASEMELPPTGVSWALATLGGPMSVRFTRKPVSENSTLLTKSDLSSFAKPTNASGENTNVSTEIKPENITKEQNQVLKNTIPDTIPSDVTPSVLKYNETKVINNAGTSESWPLLEEYTTVSLKNDDNVTETTTPQTIKVSSSAEASSKTVHVTQPMEILKYSEPDDLPQTTTELPPARPVQQETTTSRSKSSEDYPDVGHTISYEILRITTDKPRLTPKSFVEISSQSSSSATERSTEISMTTVQNSNKAEVSVTTEEATATFIPDMTKEGSYTTIKNGELEVPVTTLRIIEESNDGFGSTESAMEMEITTLRQIYPLGLDLNRTSSTGTSTSTSTATSTRTSTTPRAVSSTKKVTTTTSEKYETPRPLVINATLSEPQEEGIHYRNYVPATTSPLDDITEENVPAYLRLTVETSSWDELCRYRDDLHSTIFKLLDNGTDLNVTAEYIIFLNLNDKTCAEKIEGAEETAEKLFLPVNMFIMDKNGDFDKNLSEAFLTLWGRDGLDFLLPIRKVDFVTPIVEPSDIPDESLGPSVVAAIVISCVAGVCVILLGVLFVVMKRRQKRFNYGQRCTPVSLDAYSLDSVSIHNSVRRKGIRASKRSYGNAAFDDPEVPSHPMNFAGLANFSSDKDQLFEEFNIIPQVSPKTDELPVGAETKNRYANVIPLPETRVHLSVKDGDNLSDYINANYVRGPKGVEKLYIACQAPMDSTVEDFWRMIWEQQCKVIIMLTDLQENGVEKCAEYLPPNEVTDNLRLFGDFQITLKKRDVKEKYVISTLKLKNMEGSLWREVTHLWYLGWPEQGVPAEANSLIAFLIEARSQMKTHSGSTASAPVVVHCSPGTGRTGTVIACDLCIREFEQTRMVDIPKCVFNLRRDRAGSVQTKDQYAFIYQVLNLYATKLTGGGLESI